MKEGETEAVFTRVGSVGVDRDWPKGLEKWKL